MKEIRLKLREISSFLPYGKPKALALQFQIPEWRRKDLLSGRLDPKEQDQPFIEACFEEAKKIKDRNSKLLTF